MSDRIRVIGARELLEMKIAAKGQEAFPPDMRQQVRFLLAEGVFCPLDALPEIGIAREVTVEPTAGQQFQVGVPALTEMVEAFKALAAEQKGHSSLLTFYTLLGITTASEQLTTADVAALFREYVRADVAAGREAYQLVCRAFGCAAVTDWLAMLILAVYPIPIVAPSPFVIVVQSGQDTNQLEALRLQQIARKDISFLGNLVRFIAQADVFQRFRDEDGTTEVEPAPQAPSPKRQRIAEGDDRIEPGRNDFYRRKLGCAEPGEPPPGECARRGYVEYDLEDERTGCQIVFIDCQRVGNAAFAFLKRLHRHAAETPNWQALAGLKRRELRRRLELSPGERGPILSLFEHRVDGQWQDEIETFLADFLRKIVVPGQ